MRKRKEGETPREAKQTRPASLIGFNPNYRNGWRKKERDFSRGEEEDLEWLGHTDKHTQTHVTADMSTKTKRINPAKTKTRTK